MDHDPDRKPVFPSEIEVSLVMGRNSHDRPRAVLHEHEIRHPDRDLLPCHGIHGVLPGEDAFFLGALRTPYELLHPAHAFNEPQDVFLVRPAL